MKEGVQISKTGGDVRGMWKAAYHFSLGSQRQSHRARRLARLAISMSSGLVWESFLQWINRGVMEDYSQHQSLVKCYLNCWVHLGCWKRIRLFGTRVIVNHPHLSGSLHLLLARELSLHTAECMCACTRVCIGHCSHMEVRRQPAEATSFPSPPWSQGLDSGHQTCLLFAEASCQSLNIIPFKLFQLNYT